MLDHSYLYRWFLNKLKICTEWCAPELAESFTDAFRWDLIQIILFQHTRHTPPLTLRLTPFPHTLRVLDDIPSVARWTIHHPRPHTQHGLKSQIFRLNSVAQLRPAEKEGGSRQDLFRLLKRSKLRKVKHLHFLAWMVFIRRQLRDFLSPLLGDFNDAWINFNEFFEFHLVQVLQESHNQKFGGNPA